MQFYYLCFSTSMQSCIICNFCRLREMHTALGDGANCDVAMRGLGYTRPSRAPKALGDCLHQASGLESLIPKPGVERSLPREPEKSRNAEVITAQTV
jgi:hypothetical protein